MCEHTLEEMVDIAISAVEGIRNIQIVIAKYGYKQYRSVEVRDYKDRVIYTVCSEKQNPYANNLLLSAKHTSIVEIRKEVLSSIELGNYRS